MYIKEMIIQKKHEAKVTTRKEFTMYTGLFVPFVPVYRSELQ